MHRLTAEQLQDLIDAGRLDLIRQYHAALTPFERFNPRPNLPDEYDQQAGFVDSTAKFSICLGGTGSGKTEAAAWKTAERLRQRPPRVRCPFWIVGDTYEQVCSICWDEKLSKYIDQKDILSIDWYKQQRNWPFAVTLRHPDNRNLPGWVIEFKSYSQGRGRMQGRSIGGYWFNEEVPYQIVEEVQGRCRDYDSHGWADFTPIEVRSPEWPDKYDDPPEGWEFFHLNVLKNDRLAEGWAERYLSGFPEDERETRRIGVFASYVGQVFKEWRKPIHVLQEGCAHAEKLGIKFDRAGRIIIPHDWNRYRGIDFGFNNPFACIWVAKDRDERFIAYDEHYESQRLLAYHAEQIHRRVWVPGSPHFNRTYSDHQAQERAEMQKLGVFCTPAQKRDLAGGVSMLRSLMMMQGDGLARLYVHASCKNLIKEIRGYHWPEEIGTGNRTRNPKDLPVDYENHAIDALRYAIISSITGDGRAPEPIRRIVEPRPSMRFSFGGSR